MKSTCHKNCNCNHKLKINEELEIVSDLVRIGNVLKSVTGNVKLEPSQYAHPMGKLYHKKAQISHTHASFREKVEAEKIRSKLKRKATVLNENVFSAALVQQELKRVPSCIH